MSHSHPYALKPYARPCRECGADVGQPCSATCPTWQEPADEDADLENQERLLDLEREDPSDDVSAEDVVWAWLAGEEIP